MGRKFWFAVVAVMVSGCPIDHVVIPTGRDDGGSTGGGGGGNIQDGGGAGGGGQVTGEVSVTVIVQQQETDGGSVVLSSYDSSNSPVSLSCSDHCTLVVPRWSAVTLAGFVGTNPTLTTWSGDCAGFTESCEAIADVSRTVTATVRPFNHVFLTQAQYLPGDLGDGDGGVELADRLCQQESTNLGFSGKAVAWVSTSKQDVIDRIPAGVRGWIARSYTAAWGGKLRPFVDDLSSAWVLDTMDLSPDPTAGELGPPGYPLTGSDEFGRFRGPSCNDWTSKSWGDFYRRGYTHATGIPGWADNADFGCASCGLSRCDQPSNVLCFETNYVAPFPHLSPPPGRLLGFITRETYPSGNGVSAFDDACMADARDAGLSGTFIADVDTGNGLSRLTPQTAYSRLDGIDFIVPYSFYAIYAATPQVTADRRQVVSRDIVGWPPSPDVIVDDPTVWQSGCVAFLSTQASTTASVERADQLGSSIPSPTVTTRTCDQRARLECFQVP